MNHTIAVVAKMSLVRGHAIALALAMAALAGCQGFPGMGGSLSRGVLTENVSSPLIGGMPTDQTNQARQLSIALQIKKAGGEVTNNMALYPASTVVAIDLHATRVTDADLAQLNAFPNLRIVNLHHTRITDVGITAISKLQSLQTLYLANTEISDLGLESLQSLPQLHDLGLMSTKVTDKGMASIAHMTGLNELTLSGNQISDAGLKQLHGLSRLRKLVLIKTSVTKAGVEQFRKAVPDAHVFFG
jgi:hypothetical protein